MQLRNRRNSKGKRKKKSRESNEPQRYVFHVEAVHPEYSFGVNLLRHEASPLKEFFHPKVTGRLLVPAMQDVSEAELVLIGNRELMQALQTPERDTWEKWQPEAIGFIEVRDGKLSGVLSLPFDILCLLLPLLVTHHISVIELDGKKLKYRQSRIRSVSFATHYNPEED
jgi:hypothetical protein